MFDIVPSDVLFAKRSKDNFAYIKVDIGVFSNGQAFRAMHSSRAFYLLFENKREMILYYSMEYFHQSGPKTMLEGLPCVCIDGIVEKYQLSRIGIKIKDVIEALESRKDKWCVLKTPDGAHWLTHGSGDEAQSKNKKVIYLHGNRRRVIDIR